MAVSLLIILSVVVIFAGSRLYSQYREQVIRTEESQLLTMAGIVGNNLNSYMEQQLEEIDLFYSQEGMPENVWAESGGINARTAYFLKENAGVYNWITVTEPDGTKFRYEPGKKTFRESADGEVKAVDSQDGNHPAEITGKEISDQTGWYELYIEKNIPVGSEVYMLTFAMDLGALYEKIVAPVKIGEAGYSSVKDQNMNIIMHHVKNQIGLEAVDGRIERYPYLDMSSLNAWIMRQENENSGTGVIDTYVWDDPELKRVRRVVAFQAISIQGERWIVNSTLPVHELSGPLESMMTMLIGVMILYMLILAVIMVFFLRNRFLAESQQKEITYLKEINHGMEMLVQKNNEIRHYQRIQSLGMMASHIAHEFNNYLTPVLIYAELLENDESISSENQEMIHEITKSVDQASNLSKELLAFSRQDTGVRLEPLNFTEEVRNAVSIVRQLAPAAITLKTEIAEEPLYVLGLSLIHI